MATGNSRDGELGLIHENAHICTHSLVRTGDTPYGFFLLR